MGGELLLFYLLIKFLTCIPLLLIEHFLGFKFKTKEILVLIGFYWFFVPRFSLFLF